MAQVPASHVQVKLTILGYTTTIPHLLLELLWQVSLVLAYKREVYHKECPLFYNVAWDMQSLPSIVNDLTLTAALHTFIHGVWPHHVVNYIIH